MAGRTFEQDGFRRPLGVVAGSVFVPIGFLVVAASDEAVNVAVGVSSIVLGGLIVFHLGFWEPRRVTLDDSGVLLEAVARRVHIPWDELEAVEPWPWDLHRETLRWQRRNGRSVTMLKDFSELHWMLVEIERRAPHTYVSS
jgi:hypothetical protein